MHRFSPVATALLAVCAPVTELFLGNNNTDGAFEVTAAAVFMISASAALGLLVSLSTFLVIGHTSALTYNVVGHIKTVGIIAGGVLFYGEVRLIACRLSCVCSPPISSALQGSKVCVHLNAGKSQTCLAVVVALAVKRPHGLNVNAGLHETTPQMHTCLVAQRISVQFHEAGTGSLSVPAICAGHASNEGDRAGSSSIRNSMV